jgi:hypothetical protein
VPPSISLDATEIVDEIAMIRPSTKVGNQVGPELAYRLVGYDTLLTEP